MNDLHELVEETLRQIPRLVLERRLAQRAKEAGLSADEVTLSKAADHILSGNRQPFELNKGDEKITVEITDEDIEHVVNATEKFGSEKLADFLAKAGDDIADVLLKSLKEKWPDEFAAHQACMEAFKEHLEHRWGKALGKLRMLLAIVTEWAQESHRRRAKANAAKPSYLEDVMLRLHVRACQVTSEIVILLENGYADGAMARWRTLHEITVVAAVISKFGDEIAERYVYYQIVDSFSALKAYERNHEALGFRPPVKKQSTKVNKDYAKMLQRFGKKFGDEYGWAAHHLKIVDRGRVTFARLEEEAGDAMMRSPYKMASYNVHASPKGVYFKLGSLKGSPVFSAGASNAGLIEPAQHAAVSLAEITLLVIGDSPFFDDIVIGNVVARLEAEIPPEFGKADRKLRRDDRRHRKTAADPIR